MGRILSLDELKKVGRKKEDTDAGASRILSLDELKSYDVSKLKTGSAGNTVDAYKKYKKATQKTNDTVGGTVNPIMTSEVGVRENRNLIKAPGKTYADALESSRKEAAAYEAEHPEAVAAPQDVKDILHSGRNFGAVNPTFSIGKEYDAMTAKEAGVYTALAKRDKKQADAYLKALEMELNQRNAEQARARAKAQAEKSTVAGVGLDVAGAMSSGVGELYALWQEAKGEAIDPYHPLYGGVYLKEGAQEGLIGDSTGAEKLLKEVGIASAEWGGQALTMGPLSPLSMAMGAAGAASRDAAMRGGTAEEAASYGLLSGAAEMVAEKIGFDRYLKLLDNVKPLKGNTGEIARYLLKQIGSEGLEEGATEAANILADVAVMGDRSNMAAAYNEAKAAGMMEAEAVMEAFRQAAKQVGESAAVGALSGGLISGGLIGVDAATGRNPLERARAQYEAATRKPEDAAVGAEPITEPVRAAQTGVAGQANNMIAEREAQPMAAQEGQTASQQLRAEKFLTGSFYGEGQKVVQERLDATGNVEELDGAVKIYNAALSGRPFSEIRRKYATTAGLESNYAEAVYEAGMKDRTADLAARVKGQGKLAKGKGVILEDVSITESQKALASYVSSVGGMTVRIVDTDSDYNGWYEREKNEIVIALDSQHGFAPTLFHETTHFIRAANTEGYQRLQDAVFQMAAKIKGKPVEAFMEEYKARWESKGGRYKYGDVMEEMTADAMMEIAADEKGMRELISMLKSENPTVLEQIKEFLDKMLQTLSELVKDGRFNQWADAIHADIENTKKLRRMFAEELKAAGEMNAKAETEVQDAEQTGEVKFSKKMSFADQVDAVLDDSVDFTNSHVYVMDTPKVLTDLGLRKLPLLMTAKHIYTTARDGGKYKKVNYHDLGADLLKQIPGAMESPVAVMESATKGDSVVMVLELFDKNKNPVIVSVKLDGFGNYEMVEIEANVITSVYGKDGFNDFVLAAFKDDRFLYFDKEKSQLLSKTPGIQFPDNLDEADFTSNVARFKQKIKGYSVTETDENVGAQSGTAVRSSETKKSVRDSHGRVLSKDQQEYFKDSTAVDENGNLLVMYHGTRKGGFTVFRDWAYLTADRKYAERYTDHNTGETIYEVYANIQKPFDTRLPECREIFENEFFGSYSRTGLQETGLPDWTDGYDLAEFLEENEYDFDAILLDEGADPGEGGETLERGVSYVVRSSEQIKRTDNEHPTEDRDIRWSVRTTGEEQLMRENSSLRSENAHLQKLSENLKRQFNLTGGTTPDKASVRKVARAWLKQIESKSDLEEFSTKLGMVTEYFAKAKSDYEQDQAMAALRVLVREAMEDAETLNTELRDSYSDMIGYIKNTKLKVTDSVREELEYYGGYGDFRKAHYSSMKLSSKDGTSIDGFYYGLCQEYPEFFKEEDATTGAEQLMVISDVLETLKPVAENPYGYMLDEYVEDEAAGLLDKMADITMEKTFADKKKAEKKAALKKLKAEFSAERKKMRDETKKAQREAEKYVKEMNKHLNTERKARWEEWAKFQRLKQKNKENANKRKRSAYRKSAEKNLKELLNWLRKPNEKKHIQDAYLPLIKVLAKLDTGRNEITFKQEDALNIIARLEELEKEGYASDLTDTTRNIVKNFEDNFGEGTAVEDMNLEQMKMLRDFIKGVRAAIMEHNKAKAMEQIARISELGEDVIDKAASSKNVNQSGKMRALVDFFGLELLTPNVFFKGITDKVHQNLYKGLRTAHERKAIMVNEAMTFINKESRLRDRAKWEKEKVREFSLSNGQKAYLTVPQIMSLYCHMKREQSKVHIVGGNVELPNGKTREVSAGGILIEPYDGKWRGLKSYKNAEAAMKQAERLMVTEADIQKITDSLTEQQKKLADAIQRFFSTIAAGWGNETSMLMWGYRNFTEANYFPIESSSDFMVREYGVDENGQAVKQLKNLGFTNATVKGANNPIVIQDIFSVFAQHIDQMASYAAFVPILSDMSKFMNYKRYKQTGVTAEGKPILSMDTSVKNSIKVFMGVKAEGYINDLMRQINMSAGRDDTSSFPVQMTRRMKIAAVGANLRVMAQQPTSIVRACTKINPLYLINPANTALWADFKLMYKYAPISLWKKWGGADMDTGRTMQQMLTGGSWYDKIVDISMWGAGALDARTFGRIWKACVQETKAKHPELRGEEIYLKAGQRMADIIDETQVVDSPLHRPDIMRKSSTLMKMATSFMSEPLKTYNMFFDAARTLLQNPKDAKAYRTFVATAFTLFLNAVAVSAAAALVDAMRDDEDEEYWDKWMAAFRGDFAECETKAEKVMAWLTSNIGGNVNPAAQIPFVKDFWSVIQGYDNERMDTSWMADMVRWAKNMMEFMQGESKFTMAGMVKNTAESFSKVLGIPAKNLLRDLDAIQNTYIDHMIKAKDSERIVKQIEKKAVTHKMGSEENLNDYLEKIIKLHFTGNDTLAEKYVNELVRNGIDSDKLQEKIDNVLRDRCKAEPAAMEAAEARLFGDYSKMERKLSELEDMGYSGKIAQSAMTSLYDKMAGGAEEINTEELKEPFAGDDVDYEKIYKSELRAAYKNGGDVFQKEKKLKKLGLEEKDINGVYRDAISDLFNDSNEKGDKTEMERLIDEYVKYGGYESTLRKRMK